MLIQNEKPMLPFIHHKLSKVLTLLLALVYKKKKLDETITLTKIIKEVWYNNPDNQMEKVLTDVSAVTQHVLFSVKF